MRAIVSAFLFIAILGLAWAVQTPVSVSWNLQTLAQDRGDTVTAEEALIRMGPGALPKLREGLRSTNPNTSNHCAKLLMVLGESEGELFLLEELRAHPEPEDPAGRAAEGFLLSAWDRRDGPDEMLRKNLREVEHVQGRLPETLHALNDCLTRYPDWADGYARRARIYQKAGEVYEAKRDALAALARAPNHFEALVTLGRIQQAVDAPHAAYKCFERALLVNPRMKEALKGDIRDALKALELDKEKRRDEKRKNAPLV